MKRVKCLLVALSMAAGFVACSDDDTGLAPVFDSSSLSLEMRRDTADTYQISLPITSEEGLSKIVLVNDATGETMNEVVSFSDPFNYTYNYTLDLTAYTESTVLMMALNITDLAGQTVTKRIQLTINFPVIGVRFVGENLQSQFEDYNLKVSIDKGVTDLQKVDVYLGEELAESLTLDPALESQTINVHISGLALGSNQVRIVVVDEFDQEFTAEITVNRIEQLGFADLSGITFATGVMLNDPWFGDYPETIDIRFNRPDFSYPEGYEQLPYVPENPDKVYTMAFTSSGMMGSFTVLFALGYDDEGKVVSLQRDSIVVDYDTWSEFVATSEKYEFAYNAETNDLEQVSKDGAAYITDVKNENGYIVSYKINGQEYIPTYDENGDRVDNNYFGSIYTFSTEPNPLYIAELPAVVPSYVFGTDLSLWFYNKYLPTQLGSTAYNVSQIVNNTQTITWNKDGNEASIDYRFQSTGE